MTLFQSSHPFSNSNISIWILAKFCRLTQISPTNIINHTYWSHEMTNFIQSLSGKCQIQLSIDWCSSITIVWLSMKHCCGWTWKYQKYKEKLTTCFCDSEHHSWEVIQHDQFDWLYDVCAGAEMLLWFLTLRKDIFLIWLALYASLKFFVI